MSKKVIIVADPGIDTAFAIALALHDPSLDVIGLIPTAGNVSAEQATANVNILIDQLDPAKWPRTAVAIPANYERDGTALHGAGGLGGVQFPVSTKHQQHTADKAIVDLVRLHPREVTLVCLGPGSTVAATFARDPELPGLLEKLVIVGGCYREPGNAGPQAEFHFWMDPPATRALLHTAASTLVIPLDVTRRLVLSPSELLELPNPDSRTCKFLRQVVPHGIRASSHLYGIEGFHLKDVLGIAAIALPGSVSHEPKLADVEIRGELTRGALVIDDRRNRSSPPNIQLAMGSAIGEIRQWIERILGAAP